MDGEALKLVNASKEADLAKQSVSMNTSLQERRLNVTQATITLQEAEALQITLDEETHALQRTTKCESTFKRHKTDAKKRAKRMESLF